MCPSYLPIPRGPSSQNQSVLCRWPATPSLQPCPRSLPEQNQPSIADGSMIPDGSMVADGAPGGRVGEGLDCSAEFWKATPLDGSKLSSLQDLGVLSLNVFTGITSHTSHTSSTCYCWGHCTCHTWLLHKQGPLAFSSHLIFKSMFSFNSLGRAEHSVLQGRV